MTRILIVTGGGRGIGAATARLGGTQGYKVVVNYAKRADSANDVVAGIKKAGGDALAVQADVSTEAGVMALFAACDKTFGPVTHLFNNAGIVTLLTPIEKTDAGIIDQLWRTNISSQFLCAREAVKRMSTALGGKGGAIVNMSSAAARIGGGGGSLAYAASKGAIDTFTTGMAAELGPQGIRVNAVRPGLIETEIHADMGDAERTKRLTPVVPMKRTGTAEEVAEAVLWLLSDKASYVTGTHVDVGGGR
ncbi:MAG: SDR family oxidoreductase [Hyphomicrobiaceae bacterium]